MRQASALSAIQKASQDPGLCTALLARLEATLAGRPMAFMEVCGTHTVALFQSGLRSLLPPNLRHLSGPGCPVCVTHESEVELYLELALRPNVTIATFGDLLRVPGAKGQSLKHARASGAHVEIVYSPLDALALAKAQPEREVVFLGIGFETTAPTTAAAILSAQAGGVGNFSVLSLHKLVPPALDSLLSETGNGIDALLLPGHVATITGLGPFAFVGGQYRKPAAVGGFEPADILLALCSLASQLVDGKPCVANAYPRAVDNNGNSRAQAAMAKVFYEAPALWRGLGKIERSGLAIRKEFADYDAMAKLGLTLPETASLPGCKCGNVLKGKISPSQCPLFGKSCTPATPVGPCMVSTEGSCAAHYKYGDLPE